MREHYENSISKGFRIGSRHSMDVPTKILDKIVAKKKKKR